MLNDRTYDIRKRTKIVKGKIVEETWSYIIYEDMGFEWVIVEGSTEYTSKEKCEADAEAKCML